MVSESEDIAGRIDPDNEDLYCLECGYSLRGLPGDRPICPECGKCNPLDECDVDQDVVRKMRKRLDKRLHHSDQCVALCILLLVPILVGGWFCAIIVIVPFAIWSVLFALIVGNDLTSDSKIVRWHLLSQVVVVGGVGLACGLPFAVHELNQRFRWWDFEENTAALSLLLVSSVLVATLLAVIPFRWCRRRMSPDLDDYALRLAQQWHYDRLRTPPQLRTFW